MNTVAVRRGPLRPLTAVLLGAALGACGTVGVGVTIPIGGMGGITIGGDSSGRVGGAVGVGGRSGGVTVGGSTELPRSSDAPASSASAAAPSGAKR